MRYYSRGLLMGLALGLVLLLAGGVWAQGPSDCQKACNELKAEGKVSGPEEMGNCLDLCQKIKEAGIEGISLKCSADMVKACGVELAWDLIRHCAKPCIEFKEDACGKCLVKYSFCSKGTTCYQMVCKCFKIQGDCDQWYRQVCN